MKEQTRKGTDEAAEQETISAVEETPAQRAGDVIATTGDNQTSTATAETNAPHDSEPGAITIDATDRQRVQQGDLQWLTQLLGRQLQPKSVQVTEVEMQRDCLQISLAASEAPVPNVVVPLMHQLLGQLNLPQVHSLEIYGYEQGQVFPIWRERLASMASLVPTPANSAQMGTATPPTKNAETVAATLLERYAAGERDFTQMDCREINLTGATLTLANFEGVELMWANLSGAGLYNANLSRANLQYANLSNAVFQSAQLSGADLQNANLQGARLNGAVLRGANLLGADLTGADLTSTTLEQATLPDGTILD